MILGILIVSAAVLSCGNVLGMLLALWRCSELITRTEARKNLVLRPAGTKVKLAWSDSWSKGRADSRG